MLTALGGREARLDVRVSAALNVGLTQEEFAEALTHSAVWAAAAGTAAHAGRASYRCLILRNVTEFAGKV
jgi:alkylhydroperoxidase/carboxymuconolactone decarboxylase family protein YurZ